jgi:hypothetical protein
LTGNARWHDRRTRPHGSRRHQHQRRGEPLLRDDFDQIVNCGPDVAKLWWDANTEPGGAERRIAGRFGWLAGLVSLMIPRLGQKIAMAAAMPAGQSAVTARPLGSPAANP